MNVPNSTNQLRKQPRLSEVGDRCLDEAFAIRVIIDVVGRYQLAVGSNHRTGVSDVVITKALSQNNGVGPRNPMVFRNNSKNSIGNLAGTIRNHQTSVVQLDEATRITTITRVGNGPA